MLIRRIKEILRSNEGASLVLVSILAIVVLTAVVLLRVTTTTYIASATKQLNQDQAYELAASMGESIDNLVNTGKLDINAVPAGDTIASQTGFEQLPDSSVTATVEKLSSGSRMIVVTAQVGDATYVYTKEYR